MGKQGATFLCHVMYSSLRMARRKLGSLYWGCTKQRAVAIMAAVSGPVTPVEVRNSAMLGVRRKGTGLLASRSPGNVAVLLIIMVRSSTQHCTHCTLTVLNSVQECRFCTQSAIGNNKHTMKSYPQF